MTKFLAVCLSVMLASSAVFGVSLVPESFALAERLDTPVGFFVFETPVGKCVIRGDGMGEILRRGRRYVFFLKAGGKDSIDRLYFLEHEGDLLLFYELKDESAYLVRFDPVKRKARWITPVTARGVPVLDGAAVVIEATQISKIDGHILRQD